VGLEIKLKMQYKTTKSDVLMLPLEIASSAETPPNAEESFGR
jgi:hypothetical protein